MLQAQHDPARTAGAHDAHNRRLLPARLSFSWSLSLISLKEGPIPLQMGPISLKRGSNGVKSTYRVNTSHVNTVRVDNIYFSWAHTSQWLRSKTRQGRRGRVQ